MPSTPWSLVSYHTGDTADIRVGVLVGEEVRTAPGFLAGPSLLAVLAEWEAVAPRLRDWAVEEATPVAGARLVAPLRFPNKVLCAGANYYAHLTEMGIARPEDPGRPFFFLKPPTTAVVGPADDVRLPARAGRKIDWEAELAVVIGRRARYITAGEAREHVAGYTIVNDITSRDRLRRTDTVSEHFGYDWLAAKGEDSSCPMGPGIMPDWFVHDPQDLPIRLSVNGVVKQDSTTADMICGIWDLIAEASNLVTLEPGDVIATGSPAGVGLPRGDFLEPGDEVVVEIGDLGCIRNVMVEN